jgi:hypothetical protein
MGQVVHSKCAIPPTKPEKPERSRGGRPLGRRNDRTLLRQAALEASISSAADGPPFSAGEFLRAVMGDPKVDVRWRMDAAKELFRKEISSGADAAKLIEAVPVAEIEKIRTARQRRRELDPEWREFLGPNESLTPAECEEFAALGRWLAGIPSHLGYCGWPAEVH